MEEEMAQITLNEGLAWMKTLKKRHEELIALRNDNSSRERRFLGSMADKEIVKEPVYDVKALDRAVTRVAREIRLLEQALKATNAKTIVEGYDQDDGALGEVA
jgi:predicted esterase